MIMEADRDAEVPWYKKIDIPAGGIMRRTTLLLAAAVVGTAAVPAAAWSQPYPAKPVRVIVPHAAGGPYDSATRVLAQSLAQSLKQSFVVENRPAANGIIGAQSVAKAPPDGYTLMVTASGTISMNPFVYANLPYDPPKDFAPIIRLGYVDSLVAVHPSVAAGSFRDLLALARAKPDAISWSNWGTSSSSNLYTEWLRRARGTSFYAVPFKSAGQALNAVVAGDVHVAVYAIGQALPQVRSGKLKPLAVTGHKRSSFAPDVPTLKETGTNFDLDIVSWIGLFAPAGTPRDIVQLMNTEVGKLLVDREVAEKALVSRGIDPDEPASPDWFAEFLRRDRATYEGLAKLIGIKPE
jgi:tripartite-type tricarboxylate transporter receptor subunit TctC